MKEVPAKQIVEVFLLLGAEGRRGRVIDVIPLLLHDVLDQLCIRFVTSWRYVERSCGGSPGESTSLYRSNVSKLHNSNINRGGASISVVLLTALSFIVGDLFPIQLNRT